VILEALVGERAFRVEIRTTGAQYRVVVDDRPLEVDFLASGEGFFSLVADGESHDVALERGPRGFAVTVNGYRTIVDLGAPVPSGLAPRHAPSGDSRLVAPMPGKVVRVLVPAGTPVLAGQGLVVMEAMKMENELLAPRPGTVKEVHVREGQAVETGALLVTVE
jgi:biotin carboxyl carrier protein